MHKKDRFSFIIDSCTKITGHELTQEIKQGKRIYKQCEHCGYTIAKYLRKVKWDNGLVQLVPR